MNGSLLCRLYISFLVKRLGKQQTKKSIPKEKLGTADETDDNRMDN